MIPFSEYIGKIGRLLKSKRIGKEVFWVIFSKSGEFFLSFALLKLLTNYLEKAEYGEYSLVLTGVLLLGNFFMMPMQQAYLRYYPSVEKSELAGKADRDLVIWFSTISVFILLFASVLTIPLSDLLGLEKWTLIAGGIVFVGNRWRIFGVQNLDFRRNRRNAALHTVGFLLVLLVVLMIVMKWVGATPILVLLCYGGVAGLFALICLKDFVKNSLKKVNAGTSGIWPSLIRFGIPFGLIMTLQWIQNFSERYIISVKMDLAFVGIYVAAYQVTGIVFMLGTAVFRAWLLPIAYQRSRDGIEPRGLWEADKVLLAGIVAYGVCGIAVLPIYWLFGTELLKTLTNSSYYLPSGVILAIAIVRFLQGFGPLIEGLFAVHLRMTVALIFRLIGSAVVIPVCWYSIGAYGVKGAVWGVMFSSIIYIMFLVFSPRGLISLLDSSRRAARTAFYVR